MLVYSCVALHFVVKKNTGFVKAQFSDYKCEIPILKKLANVQKQGTSHKSAAMWRKYSYPITVII